ncbi:MAG: endo alpha-1,4 polygalactosaminidase [Rhodospirillales bacterium]|nr:endo alpha-1,4 polygalactosaminidase [Rhodospirillales bacterium]
MSMIKIGASWNVLSATLAALALVCLTHTANAQQQGTVRAQGVDVTPGQNGGTGRLFDTPLRDPRQDIRTFIQDIAAYARGFNKDFIVVPVNAGELVTFAEDGDETRRVPAVTFIRSIDGILEEGVFFGRKVFGKAEEKDPVEAHTRTLDTAKTLGVQVLVVDYAKEAESVSESYRRNAEKGYIPFVAPASGMALNHLPDLPARPFRENPDNIINLKQVRNFLMVRDSAPFGNEDQYAMALHGTNYDAVIVDVFHRRAQPLTRRAVETLKYKKIGARRLVLAYLDIGTAAKYRYYWKANWKERSPSWITAPTSGNPDRYYVEYWNPEWQQVIFGNPASYVYGIVKDLGFDGVVLDGVDSYKYYDGTIDE